MSNISDEKEHRRPKGEETPRSKLDYDLLVGVFIFIMIFTVLGLWIMTRLYP